MLWPPVRPGCRRRRPPSPADKLRQLTNACRRRRRRRAARRRSASSDRRDGRETLAPRQVSDLPEPLQRAAARAAAAARRGRLHAPECPQHGSILALHRAPRDDRRAASGDTRKNRSAPVAAPRRGTGSAAASNLRLPVTRRRAGSAPRPMMTPRRLFALHAEAIDRRASTRTEERPGQPIAAGRSRRNAVR